MTNTDAHLSNLLSAFLSVGTPEKRKRYDSDSDSDLCNDSDDERAPAGRRVVRQRLACGRVAVASGQVVYEFGAGDTVLVITCCAATHQMIGAGCVGFVGRELILDPSDAGDAQTVADALRWTLTHSCTPAAVIEMGDRSRFRVCVETPNGSRTVELVEK